MHILFFIQSMSAGGAERVTANLANHWARCGHVVTVVTQAPIDTDVHELDTLLVRRLSLGTAKPSRTVVDALISNVQRVRYLSRILHREQPDVAIGFMTTASCLLAMASGPARTIKIGTERNFPPRLPLPRLWQVLRKHSYRFLDAVVAQTPAAHQWLAAQTNSRLLVTIPNPLSFPVPDTEPNISPSTFFDANEPLLLAVGSLTPQKGFDRLIKAFLQARREFGDWKLVILGEGGMRWELEALIRELGLIESVYLPGHAGNIGAWYERADVFALSSLHEGFPNVLIEAMAYGCPVISVDCDDGPRTIISHGENGLLIPQDHPDALAKSLAVLFGDAELRHALGKGALTVHKHFGLSKIAENWERLIKRIELARGGGW